MAFIILFSLRVDNRARQMDKAVTSVYEDRLQPALIIVYLSENLHAKRQLLENHLNRHSRFTEDEVKAKLLEYDTNNDKLVSDFEKTVLTRNEAAVLTEFKKGMAANSRMEGSVLRRSATERELAATLYNKDGVPHFSREHPEPPHPGPDPVGNRTRNCPGVAPRCRRRIGYHLADDRRGCCQRHSYPEPGTPGKIYGTKRPKISP